MTSTLADLFDRVAVALENSARLADHGAELAERLNKDEEADLERERAARARRAADRAHTRANRWRSEQS